MISQKLPFKVDPNLKNIIGKELITNDFMAVFEIVKNSYDADASESRIIFDVRSKPNKNSIYIIDNGIGMDYNDIVNKFLVVGFSEKKYYSETDYRSKIKSGRKRNFAGAKGIGRFSCDRLGKKLTVYTKKEDDTGVHVLTIDWNDFEKENSEDFESILQNYEKREDIDPEKYGLPNFLHGTIIEITGLNSSWNYKRFVRLKTYLKRLINPLALENDEFKILLDVYGIEDEERSIKENPPKKNPYMGPISGWIDNLILEDIDMQTVKLKCSIDKSGKNIYTEIFDENKMILRIKESNLKYPSLKNMSINLYYLNENAKKAFKDTVGTEPVNYGSIFLYKGGMRIHPYGDEGDDWLDLEPRKTQGYARFLSTRELLGSIELNGYQSKFEEVSSRDAGLFKNEAFYQLKSFYMENVQKLLEDYVVKVIDWDRAEKQKSENKPIKTASDIKKDFDTFVGKFTKKMKTSTKKVEIGQNLLEFYKMKQLEIPKIETPKKTSVKKPEKDTPEKPELPLKIEKQENIQNIEKEPKEQPVEKISGIQKPKIDTKKENKTITPKSTITKIPEPKEKIFISHAYADKKYLKRFIELLEGIGMDSNNIICSSIPGYDFEPGDDILDCIKSSISDNTLVLYVLSKNFKNSGYCLGEMGAAWVLSKETIPVIIPPFKSDEIKGFIPSSQKWMKINNREDLNSFKEKLENYFQMSPTKYNLWESKRDTFIQNMDDLIEKNSQYDEKLKIISPEYFEASKYMVKKYCNTDFLDEKECLEDIPNEVMEVILEIAESGFNNKVSSYDGILSKFKK
ncbi:ATP-binding protein [Methanococcus maripaludis]|uniref:TIR domain-containing protein n=1 Tax=Methanococcus maripaludis TaxID=39152 RepID=A0A7J9PTG8_METMI|nr:ATP-binding protein [Methanococcus maripaludis]MBA2868867.1 hypothetical protein [Methanococcus maripaludis]